MTKKNSEKKKPVRFIKKNGRVIPIHERQRQKKKEKITTRIRFCARVGIAAGLGAGFHVAEQKVHNFITKGDASIPWTDKGLEKYARAKQEAANAQNKSRAQFESFPQAKNTTQAEGTRF